MSDISDSDFVATREELLQRLTSLRAEYATLQESVTAKDLLIAGLKELNKLDKEVHSKMPELVGEIAHLTQQLAAANGRVEKLVAAATPVLRNELDKVEVHPCDYNDDTARARQCTAEVQELFAALSDLPYEVPSFDERSSEADKEK